MERIAATVIYRSFVILGIVVIFYGCIFDDSGDTTNTSPDPPAGAAYAYVPNGSTFDFSTGTVDATAQSGDFLYEGTSIWGLAAPSGVSWWESGGIMSFESYISNPGYLPPAEAWRHDSGTSGSAGKWTRWLKTEEGKYAMIFSLQADADHFDFFYVEPYGEYTWSDHEKPIPPVLLSINSAGMGELLVSWQHSPSPDVAGYWVNYGESTGSVTGKHAGYTTNYTLTELASGHLYYVFVIAYDNEGNQSDESNIMTGVPG